MNSGRSGADSRTRLAALFGHPVGHSLSPVFQNAAFRQAGLNAVYLAFDVGPERLPAALAAVRGLDLLGANLTIPHKERAGVCLDELSRLAERTGSVNTVVNRDGRLRGETTDGSGFLRALEETAGVNPAGRRVLLLGTGGAGRALAFALAEAGAELWLVNRTAGRAERLAGELARFHPAGRINVGAFETRAALLERAGIEVLVNATSVGLKPGDPPLFAAGELPGAGLTVCDLIYHRETDLLKAAAARGLKRVDGLGMLVHQGAISFELWTGRPAPLAAMFEALSPGRVKKT
ncbi:MAG TPA: shikimate dehydrogenase [bacterium]|uniref:Shikimate dehydrogenase (NADP(+)) n=1 Tax=candidate division TA06 bacterium ADurb.Bin417 TaxID=1852828 RepID=A0A1V5MH55_UNCT6|nr:MAG: Shikimate dehydrogenase [candidate division TA06 bacterium ADurb.Bin417]HNQ34700.1 shikimate dehydrogenase [bacterium]HNS49195.1 shikimate dehydrogenase [bacterium]